MHQDHAGSACLPTRTVSPSTAQRRRELNLVPVQPDEEVAIAMALRAASQPFRRLLSGTSRSAATGKLPFEKPIFESSVLKEAKREQDQYHSMEFIGNVVVIMVAASAVGRVAYYIAYGKEGGAEALPKRK